MKSVDEITIKEIEELFGFDKIEPILISDEDFRDCLEDAEYFRPMYEESLRESYREFCEGKI